MLYFQSDNKPRIFIWNCLRTSCSNLMNSIGVVLMKRILVVDDSVTLCNKMEAILTKAGHQVRIVNDGNQALDTAKAYNPHMIFMDVTMPIVDGFAATRLLKADAETKNIPIVFLTSKDQKADKVWGQILGGAGYLTKPCEDECILNEVNRVAL